MRSPIPVVALCAAALSLLAPARATADAADDTDDTAAADEPAGDAPAGDDDAPPADDDPDAPPADATPPVATGYTERVEIIASPAAEQSPAAAVDEVGRDDIEASGARTAADALRLVPGVTLETGARGEARLQVRGFDHNRVQVLVDGVPLSNPYDGGMDLAALSASQIDAIRVGRGNASSSYGGGALGGVVEIDTLGPPADPTFHVRAGGGSGWRGEVAAGGGAAIGPVRVGVGWELRNRPYFLLPASFPGRPNEGGGRRENSDRRDQQLHATMGIGEGLQRLTLRTTFVDVRRGVPPHIDEAGPRYWRWDLWRDQFTSLSGRTPLGTRVLLRGAAFVRFRRDVLDAYDGRDYATQDTAGSFTSTYVDRGAGGVLGVDVDLGRDSLLVTTLSYRHDHHESQGDAGEEWRVRDGDAATLAPSATIRIARPLTAEVGLDVHLWQPRDDEELEHRAPVGSIDPRVGLVVRPVEPLAVRVSGGRRSRFPTLKEMYTTQLGFIVANPDLRPEHAWSVDLGLSAAAWQRRLVVAATGYYSDVTDLIERTTTADGDRMYTNVSRSRHAGVELRVIGRPHPALEFELGYDLLHARNTSADRASDLLEYRPPHRLRVRAHVEAPFGLQAGLVWTLVGERHYLAVEATGELAPLPAYSRLDASLRQSLGKGFSIYVIGTNLYDTLYEEIEGYPRAGIEILGGVEFRGTAPDAPSAGRIPPRAGGHTAAIIRPGT